MSEKSSFIGVEKRNGGILSPGRTWEILDAFNSARRELVKLRSNVRARLLQRAAAILRIDYADIDISCRFRETDSPADLRGLFIDASRLSEANSIGSADGSYNRLLAQEEFSQARAAVLADFAEILVRSGIVSRPPAVDKNPDIVFEEGKIYRIKIHGVDVLAYCAGFTGEGYCFNDGSAIPYRVPIFQFRNPGNDGVCDDYKIGQEYGRVIEGRNGDSGSAAASYSEFCGYTWSGRPVMKFLRRQAVSRLY